MRDTGPVDPAETMLATPSSPGRKAPWWRNLLFALAVTALFFGGLEAALRAAYPAVRTATMPDGMIRSHLTAVGFRYDPDLYWYWAMLPSKAMQINQYGFRRVKPMTARKPAGVTRVVTLGDSQTLGAGVGAGETYSAFAEEALGPDWEVLNAGISGYRTLNIYRLLQLRIAYFQPDIIVVDCMPFDSPRDDGPLKGTPLRTSVQRVQALLWESALYHSLQLALEKVRPNRERWLDRTAEERPGDELGQGNHDLILEWGREQGVQVVFMEYPVQWDGGGLGCQTREGELPPGAPVAPACQRLAATGKPASDLFLDRNHLSVEGNRVVGRALADTLKQLKSSDSNGS